MKSKYGQYCPLALATELLCRRWTILVLSRLFDGCEKFNQIHRGIPRISPALLSKRLKELEDADLIYLKSLKPQRGHSYHLTEAGKGLEDVIEGLGVWGHQWAREMIPEDLDIAFLAWSMHLRMNVEAMPEGRTVIEFYFSGAPKDCCRFWIVKDNSNIEMCLKYPGFETDLFVTSDIFVFVETWRGFRSFKKEIAAKRIKLDGPRELVKAFPDWLLLSLYAHHKRLKKTAV